MTKFTMIFRLLWFLTIISILFINTESKIMVYSVIFMLLIFFMVTTVMKTFDGLKVQDPSAKKIEKLENRKNVIYIWQTKDGSVCVDDQTLSNIDDVSEILKFKLESSVDPGKMVVQFKSDQNTTMELIQQVHTECREANALKLSYAAKKLSD